LTEKKRAIAIAIAIMVAITAVIAITVPVTRLLLRLNGCCWIWLGPWNHRALQN
jgi:hypothetical protein